MKTGIFLTCEFCVKNFGKKHRNYRTSVTAKKEKLTRPKYCKFCQKTQIHKQENIK